MARYVPGFYNALGANGHSCPLPAWSKDDIRPDWVCGICGQIWRSGLHFWQEVGGPQEEGGPRRVYPWLSWGSPHRSSPRIT